MCACDWRSGTRRNCCDNGQVACIDRLQAVARPGPGTIQAGSDLGPAKAPLDEIRFPATERSIKMGGAKRFSDRRRKELQIAIQSGEAESVIGLGTSRPEVRYLRRNGSYLFVSHALDRLTSTVRNRMLAAKLGVRELQIGPGATLGGLSSMRLGENFAAGPGLWMEAIREYNGDSFEPRLIIGNNVSVSAWCHIAVTNHVEIGDGVLIGSKVLITDHNHGQYSDPFVSPAIRPTERPLERDRQVIVGRNCWLGDGVVVTPDSEIGEGAVIGANSVVIGAIPAFCIAAGAPAKPLKQYDFAKKEWVRLT